MVTEILEASTITIALLAVSIAAVVTVVMISAYAYRQGRRLERWNARNRREDASPAALRRRRGLRWSPRRTVWG